MTTPVHVHDLTFDVRDDGTGDPVILLHGWPESSRSWQGVVERLMPSGLRLVRPDQRGYSPGARPTEVSAYGTDVLADDVLAIADRLGIDDFHLVGHDWGAAVAWHLSAHHPERIRTLTALSVPHLAAYGEALLNDPDAQARAAYIRLLRTPGKAEEVLLADDAARLRAMYQGALPTEDEDAYVAMLSAPGALTATLNWYRAMAGDLRHTPAVSVPTTFVWGADDLAIGRAGAERTADFVTGDYRFVEVDGGHWLLEQETELVASEILRRIG